MHIKPEWNNMDEPEWKFLEGVGYVKSFRLQLRECLQKTGNCELRKCDKEIQSFHNGIIKMDQEYFCKKHNTPCSSGVCRDERVKKEVPHA